MNSYLPSVKRLSWKLLPKSNFLYRVCKKYVDLYTSENDDDMRSNGEFYLMRHVIPRCRVVFDVGANVGHWASLAVRINAAVSLHCFEPSRATYQHLVNKFKSNVICNNFGMGSTLGTAKLFIFEQGSGINSLYQRQGLESFGLETQRHEEIIRLDTIDHYCHEHGIEKIDFLKIDVEGHELEVFKGMREILAQGKVDFIQFEYGGANIDSGVLLKDIFNIFQPFSYDFYKIYPRYIKKIAMYDQRLENFQYQNWVIVRSQVSLGALMKSRS